MSARQRAYVDSLVQAPPGNDDFLNSGNCENSTVSPRRHQESTMFSTRGNDEVSTVSSTTSPGTCKPAQQEHRPPGKELRKGVSMVFPNRENHVNRPRHHDRDVDDQHARHNRGIDHLVQELQLGNHDGPRQSGPWDKPLRHEREICTTCKQGH